MSNYLGFTPGDDPAQAAAIFAQRYGQAPRETVRTGGALLVGPLPDSDGGGALAPRPPDTERRAVLSQITAKVTQANGQLTLF